MLKPFTGRLCGALRARGALAAAGSLLAAGALLPMADLAAAAPSGRAYEQVSPVDKRSNNVSNATVQAASSGDAVAFSAPGAFPGAPTNLLVSYYLARRGADWTTTSLDLPQWPSQGLVAVDALANTSDLSRTLVMSGRALAPGGVEGNGNLYLRDNADGSLRFVATTPDPRFIPLSATNVQTPYEAMTDDGRHIVFSSTSVFTPDAVAGESNLYEVVDGAIRRVDLMPDGSPAPGGDTFGNGSVRASARQMSADGRRIFFEATGLLSTVALYLREDGERTIPISVSTRPGDPAEAQGADFGGASADGSIVYFVSSADLTPESNTQFSGSLYRYDVERRELTDLTTRAPIFPDVSTVLGVSPDGAYVWFVSGDELAPGGISFERNIYVWHDGEIRFKGLLDPSEYSAPPAWNVSPDGRRLAFMTVRRPDGYDNGSCRDAFGMVRPCYVVMTVAADDAQPARCVSCNPSGALPRGDATLNAFRTDVSRYYPNVVLDDGRVYFDSSDRLVRDDVNGRVDVYEWTPASGATLISSGRASTDSAFAEATPDGASVYFRTDEQLVAQDRDAYTDLYVARAGGGIASQNVDVSPPAPCEGEDCRGRPTPPPPAVVPPSAVFSGPGDFEQRASAPRPALSVRALGRAQRSLLLRRGLVALSVRVTVPGKVTVTARGRLRGRMRVLARASATARRAGTLVVRLSVPRAARRALRPGAVVRLTVAHTKVGTPKVLKVTLR